MMVQTPVWPFAKLLSPPPAEIIAGVGLRAHLRYNLANATQQITSS
jgi:hypothetical protein